MLLWPTPKHTMLQPLLLLVRGHLRNPNRNGGLTTFEILND